MGKEHNLISQTAFEQAVEEIGIGKFRGFYQGRAYHKGVAVVFDGPWELGLFVGKLSTMPDFAKLSAIEPHTDDMGRGIVASWNESLFTD
jgi:hypothetical protein